MRCNESLSELSRSDYGIQEIMQQTQFIQLSKEIQQQNSKRDEMVKSFYRYRHSYTAYDPKPSMSQYEKMYRKWKDSEEQKKQYLIESTVIDKSLVVTPTTQSNSVTRHQIDSRVMDNIREDYNDKLQSILNNFLPFLSSFPKKQNITVSMGCPQSQPISVTTPSQYIQIIQQPYPDEQIEVMRRRQINTRCSESCRETERLRQKCYIDIIKHPPRNIQQLKWDDNSKTQSQSSGLAKSQGAIWRLKIKQILAIPHRQFLLFFQANEREIRTLATQEQLKDILHYRGESLQKEEQLQELRRKVADNEYLISKLSNEQKGKLFKVLYCDDVDKAKLQFKYQ